LAATNARMGVNRLGHYPLNVRFVLLQHVKQIAELYSAARERAVTRVTARGPGRIRVTARSLGFT
jgi:hypothetical protein